MKKKLTWIALALVLLLVVGVTAVVLNLNGIVRGAVERGTSQSLELKTTLDKANVGLLSGDVSLNDLSIASPEGFSAPQMLSLGHLSVDTSYGKVFGTPTAIDSIVIEKPKLVLEFVGTKSNLKTVADRLASSTSGSGDQPKPAGDPLKLIIDQLKVSGAQVEIRSDLLGKPILIDIPAVEMSQIGNADGNRNGEEAGKVVSQLITRLSIEAQKSGKLPPELAAILSTDLDSLINNIGGQFAAQADQLKAQAMQQVDALKGQAEQAVNDAKGKAEDAINDAKKKAEDQLKGLGGILGGGKKDEPKEEKK
jgi:uncharacterized protein involved in outer membrane biogenesis